MSNEATQKTIFDLCKSYNVDAAALRIAGAASLALTENRPVRSPAKVEDDEALRAAVRDMEATLDFRRLIETVVWASWVMQARIGQHPGTTTDELVFLRKQIPTPAGAVR
jgi:hypothetical protein